MVLRFGFIIKDFSRAIEERLGPRNSIWSRLMGVMIANSISLKILVASNLPPIPHSTKSISAGILEKARIAAAVVPSKKVGLIPSGQFILTVSIISYKKLSSIGVLFRIILSLKLLI